tara:strand:+ start:509 stop:982 length:474 start_codon:yes stop_codon:yes gene_type:complete
MLRIVAVVTSAIQRPALVLKRSPTNVKKPAIVFRVTAKMEPARTAPKMLNVHLPVFAKGSAASNVLPMLNVRVIFVIVAYVALVRKTKIVQTRSFATPRKFVRSARRTLIAIPITAIKWMVFASKIAHKEVIVPVGFVELVDVSPVQRRRTVQTFGV